MPVKLTSAQRRVLLEAVNRGGKYVVARDQTIQALWVKGLVYATGEIKLNSVLKALEMS